MNVTDSSINAHADSLTFFNLFKIVVLHSSSSPYIVTLVSWVVLSLPMLSSTFPSVVNAFRNRLLLFKSGSLVKQHAKFPLLTILAV